MGMPWTETGSRGNGGAQETPCMSGAKRWHYVLSQSEAPMQRQRTVAEIRADAIKMAIKKGAEGCDGCARSYFDLARRHGATEEDIERAILAADGPTGMSRRDLLKLAAVGAARLAVLSAAAGSLAPPFVGRALARTTAPTDAQAQVAWVIGPSASTAAGRQLIAIDPRGQIGGRVTVTGHAVVRSADGATVYTVEAHASGATSTTVVTVYDASTGALRHTVTGHTLPLGFVTGWDMVEPAISADGRYLAVLHSTRYVITPAVRHITKRYPNGTTRVVSLDDATIITGLEIIDLQVAQSLDYLALGSSPTGVSGGHIVIAPDDHIYVFTHGVGALGTVMAAQFDGQRLAAAASAIDGQGGHAIPAAGPDAHIPSLLTADGRTLVRLVDPEVQWLDLQALTLKSRLNVAPSIAVAKSFPPAGLFSPDKAMLYIARPAIGVVQAVNIQTGAEIGSLQLPLGIGRSTDDTRAVRGATLSPDGATLYMVDGRSANGVWAVSVPTLTVAGNYLSGHVIQDVWASGATLYAQELHTGHVYVLQPDGTVVHDTAVGDEVFGFIETVRQRL